MDNQKIASQQRPGAPTTEETQKIPGEQRLDGRVNGQSDQARAETEKLTIWKNRDNDSLLPRGNEKFIVGFVDEVNGAGTQEVPTYDPTRREILELVKYWYCKILNNHWFFFILGGTGSSEARLNAFARRRIDRAAAAIGQEAVDNAIKEVREDFRSKVVKDDDLWRIFENGTQEQWDEVLDNTYRKWREGDAAEAIKRLEQSTAARVPRRLYRVGAARLARRPKNPVLDFSHGFGSQRRPPGERQIRGRD